MFKQKVIYRLIPFLFRTSYICSQIFKFIYLSNIIKKNENNVKFNNFCIKSQQ